MTSYADEYMKRASAALIERRKDYKTSSGYSVAEAADLMKQFDDIRHMVMSNAAARGIDLSQIIIVKR